MSKTIIFIVVIIIAVVVGVVFYTGSQSVQRESIIPLAPTEVPVIDIQANQDQTLDSEVLVIDAQIDSLNTDAENITQSINDTPIDPTL